MRDEPVRGGFPDPSFYAQAGIEQARAWQQNRTPHDPLSHLTGIRPTQVRAGAVTLTMPASPWLATHDGAVNVEILLQDALEFAVLTGLPPDHEMRTASLVYNRLRPCRVESENFVARATTVYAGRTFTLAEVFIEDANGRDVAHGSAGVTFLRPVLPDGSELMARGVVSHEGDGLYLSTAEVTDVAGNVVAVGRRTSRFAPPRPGPNLQANRVLATVLFTDIVGSTEAAARMGDIRWREILERHHALIRRELEVWKGREVKTTGDGFLATFDSPGRAVQCARAIRDGVRRLGLEVRVGLHTGECEISGADVAGIAVHIAARIQALAEPGEILVSGTVRDLVTGSGLRFVDRGRHTLKGIEGDWRLFAVEG